MNKTRPRLQLCQAKGLDKEWTLKKIGLWLVELNFLDFSLMWSNKLNVLKLFGIWILRQFEKTWDK